MRLLRGAWDTLGLPFRVVLEARIVARLGWTTLEDERLRAVLPHVRGRLLDVGAGGNALVRRYRRGVGVDVVVLAPDVLRIAQADELPFRDCSFDTVTFVASLNYVPDKPRALVEVRRVLRPGGRLIVTMIDPIVGALGHAVWSHGERRGARGARIDDGMWPRAVLALADAAGFAFERHERFVYGLNQLFVFRHR